MGRIPVTPVVKGRPVALVNVAALGVPRLGVVRLGDVPKTRLPVPVDVVMALKRFALDGVPRNVATPVPKPLTPVLIGSPVAFVKTAADGVPSAGAISVGEFARTALPVPLTVQFAAMGGFEPEALLQSTEFCATEASPTVPVPVIVPPVTPLFVAMLVTVPDVVDTGTPPTCNPVQLSVVVPVATVQTLVEFLF